MKNANELFERVANNIAHDILQFDNHMDLDEYLSENFQYTWLDSSDEWVINFDCEVLFDGFKTEKEARELFSELNNRVWEIVNSYL